MVQTSRFPENYANKVPEVTLGFWIIKILATTLGETGGDTVTMTLNLGYLTGTAIFLSVLVVLVGIQIAAKKFHPFLYWSVIVASTTAGTTMTDFATRSFGYRLHWRVTDLVRLPHGLARLVVLVAGLHLGRIREHAKGGSLLLGQHYIFADVGHRPWRLDRRHRWSLVRRWGAGVRCRISRSSRRVLLDRRVASPAVLGRVHSHPTIGGYSRGFARQAPGPWWVRVKPPACFGGYCGGDDRLHHCFPSKGRRASGSIRNAKPDVDAFR